MILRVALVTVKPSSRFMSRAGHLEKPVLRGEMLGILHDLHRFYRSTDKTD
jgi:hypothetical protein